MQKFRKWKMEFVGIGPVLAAKQREVLIRHDVIPQDLNDLTANME
jgi:hypothetical protein